MSLFSMCMMANSDYGFKIIVARLLEGRVAFCCYYVVSIAMVS